MVVEVAKKGRTIRQGSLVQLGCSLAGINREAFEAVGTWGRVGKLLKKRRCKDRWKRKKKDTRQNKNSKKVEHKVSRKNEIQLKYERYETSRFSHYSSPT